jgi:hypothetical protein
MAHELLIGKPLIGLLFLMLGYDLARDEFNWLGHYLRDNELVMPDFLLHVRDPLQRCDDEVSQHLAVTVGDFLIAVSLMRVVRIRSVRFELLILFLFLGFLHFLIGILNFDTLVILARVVVRSWLALNVVLIVKVLILHLRINWLFLGHIISLIGNGLEGRKMRL